MPTRPPSFREAKINSRVTARRPRTPYPRPHGPLRGSRVRAAHDRGARDPVRPPLVHRRPRVPEGVHDHLAGARGRPHRRDGLRRLLDRRVRAHPGVGHGRAPGSLDLPGDPVEDRAARGAHVLRHPRARRHAVRRRPARRPQAPGRPRGRQGLHVLRRPGARVLLLQVGRRPHVPRPGRLLRRDAARRGHRLPQAHRPVPRVDGDPGRVRPPRGGAEPARDRPPLHRRPHDGRPGDDVPPHGEGGRARVRDLRDVHAEARRRA